MSRSIKKGPFVAPELFKRIEQLNNFRSGKHGWQECIDLHAWNFVRIPRSTKNIAVEEVDTAVIVIVCLSFYTALLLG